MAMFSSKDPSSPKPPPQPAGSADFMTGTGSVIGRDTVVEGTIRGSENVSVEGVVRGAIELQSDLRIGAGARVESNVHARNVLVEGTLIGDLSADRRVELLTSAVVDGNISAPKIVVAEGAKFSGSVEMGVRGPEESGGS